MSEVIRVLIVEDNRDLSAIVGDYLEADGHMPDFAFDGKSALRLALSETYDVIVLDIMLPGMDGYDVIQRLRANRVDTPVLVQSALVDRDFAIQGMSLGVDDYLIKPYSQNELAVRIESGLDRAYLRGLAEEQEPQRAGADQAERRRAGRKPMQMAAEILAPESDRAMACTVINLSDDGAALKPADPPNCPPRFRLEVSNGVSRHCEVCWRYRNKVGIHFVEA